MAYLLYTSHLDAPRKLSRGQAQHMLRTATVRSYASSCSCVGCRTYVLYLPSTDIVNLRIASERCHTLTGR